MQPRRLLAAAVILSLGVVPACSRKTAPQRTEAEAYSEAKSAYYEAETPEAIAGIAERYLAEFPGGEHAPSFAWVEVEYRGNQLGEKDRAYDTVKAALDAATDPATALDITLTLYPLARELGRPLDIAAAVAAVEKERPLTFRENRSVMEVASKHELWDLLLDRADAALAQATPEAIAAEHPDRKMDADTLQETADRRASEAMAYKAWALHKTGRTGEAETLFAAAEERTLRNYVGLPTSPVALFWGRAALERGDWDRAMELLAPEAVMGGDEEALAGLETAYREKHGSTDGFDEYLTATRRALSRPVDDFTLADYDGTDHTLSKELGKVTLLAFWFPT